MHIQVAFTIKGFAGSMTHELDIQDKDSYDVDKLKGLIQEAVDQNKTEAQLNLDLVVDKIIYVIQTKNIPD